MAVEVAMAVAIVPAMAVAIMMAVAVAVVLAMAAAVGGSSRHVMDDRPVVDDDDGWFCRPVPPRPDLRPVVRAAQSVPVGRPNDST